MMHGICILFWWISNRNVNNCFRNNASVTMDVMVFVFYSDELAIDVMVFVFYSDESVIDVETGLVTK